MTTDEIEELTTAVKASIRKTPVQVYDNNGYLTTFYKEDIVDICASRIPGQQQTFIILANGAQAIYFNSKNEVQRFNTIAVFGSPNKWRKLLDFNPTCLNPQED